MVVIAKGKYKEWRELHQLASIFGFLFFLILSISGTVLTFRPELSAMTQTNPLAGLLMYVMHILHTHLALGGNTGISGYFLAGLFSLVCVVMIVSGLLIYRPHALSCHAMREQARRTGRLSHRYWVTFLHQELSAMAAVWGVLLCFSGAWIAVSFILIMSGSVSPQIMATGGGAFGTGGMALKVGADAGIGMQLTQFMLAIHLHNHDIFLLRVLWAIWMLIFMAAGTIGMLLLAKKQWGSSEVRTVAIEAKEKAAVHVSDGWSVWFLPFVWGILTLGGLILPLFGFIGNLFGALCLIIPFFLLGYEIYQAAR